MEKQILLDKRIDILTGRGVDKLDTTKDTIGFFDLCDKYLNWVQGRQAAYSKKKNIAKKFKMFFGNRALSEFTFMLVESYQDGMIKKGYKASYVNKNLAVLKHMLHKALDWELISEAQYNKVLRVKQLKGENKRLRYLTAAEEKMLVEYCEPNLKPIVVTALNSGMRLGEILSLKWNRVDLKNRLILLDKTKNFERREIPISDDLAAVLSGMVRNLKVDYVFYNPKTMTRWERLKDSWERAVKKAKLTDFHFHDLRHTFASKLVMAGVPLLTVSKLLGHKDVKMTLRYAHLAPSAFRDAIAVLNKKRCKIVAVEKEEKISNP